jgi:hypothetical protein
VVPRLGHMACILGKAPRGDHGARCHLAPARGQAVEVTTGERASPPMVPIRRAIVLARYDVVKARSSITNTKPCNSPEDEWHLSIPRHGHESQKRRRRFITPVAPGL